WRSSFDHRHGTGQARLLTAAHFGQARHFVRGGSSPGLSSSALPVGAFLLTRRLLSAVVVRLAPWRPVVEQVRGIAAVALRAERLHDLDDDLAGRSGHGRLDPHPPRKGTAAERVESLLVEIHALDEMDEVDRASDRGAIP